MMRRFIKVIFIAAWLFTVVTAEAAITFRTAGTEATAFAQTIEVSLPAGQQDDDLLVLVVLVGDDVAVTINEAGWTKDTEVQDVAGGDKTIVFGYKVASSESGTYTVDIAGGSSKEIRAMMFAYDGVDTSTPINAVTTTNSGTTNSTTHNPAAITTATDGAWVLSILGVVQNANADGTEPSGYTLRGEGGSASGVQPYWGMGDKTVAAAGPEDPGNWTALGAGTDSASITAAIRPAGGAAPTFDSNPTLDTCTATGCTFDYDADATADTIWSMFTDTAAAAPTCAAIEAGTGNHGTATEATTGASDSITITATDTPEFPLYDAHFCLEEGTSNYSSVVTVSDNAISDPTGEQFIAITSIGSGSPCESFNTATAPDIANGDYLLANDTTDPGAYVLTVGADCRFSYSGDSSRQSVLNIDVYDASAGDWHADDIDYWNLNEAPVCDVAFRLAFNIDEAITSIIVANDTGSICTDGEGDTLTTVLTSGTLPTGITAGGTGNGTLSGTPTVEDETGAALLFTVTDIAGDTDTQNMTLYPIDTVTMPTLTDSDLSAAITDELTAFPWRVPNPLLTAGFACNDVEAANQVVSQNPAASSEVAHDAAISIIVSTGVCGKSLPGAKMGIKGPRVGL